MPSRRREYTRRAILASGAATLLAGCRTAQTVQTSERRDDGTATPSPTERGTIGDDTRTATSSSADLDGEWLMEGFDAANTKHAPDVTVPDATEQWEVTGATEQGDVLGTPAVAGETLYIGNGYRYLALDVASGTLAWDRDLDLQVAFYSPAVHEDAVLVPGANLGSGSNGLYALDLADGSTTWRVDLPLTSSPVVAGDRAYLSVDGNDGTTLSARSVTDGTEELAVPFDPVDGGARYAPKPAVVDGTIYLPVEGLENPEQSVLLALDAEDGTEQWRRPLGAVVESAPAVANGRVYVGTGDGTVVAVARDTGTIDWRTDAVKGINKSPCLAAGMVVVVDVFGTLYGLDADEGAVEWSIDAKPPNRTRPVAGGGTVVLSGDSLLAVDAETGERQWGYRMTDAASYSFTPTALLDGAFVTASCTKTEKTQRMYDNNVHLFQ